MSIKKSIFLIFVLLLIVGCRSNLNETNTNAFGHWKYSDVRLLDPVDTVYSEQDLISVYARNNAQFFQVRLDFLELNNNEGRDIYIPIDTNPGGVNWITLRK